MTCDVCGPGRLPSGRTEIPFELPLQPRPNRTLYETYHGVFINISYSLRCDIRRSFLSKDLQKGQQFLVQYRPQAVKPPRPVPFTISPGSLASGGAGAPDFTVKGHLDSTRCSILKPLTGHITLEKCAAAVRSIELQLVRVETCGCAEGYARDGKFERRANILHFVNVHLSTHCWVECNPRRLFKKKSWFKTTFCPNWTIGGDQSGWKYLPWWTSTRCLY